MTSGTLYFVATLACRGSTRTSDLSTSLALKGTIVYILVWSFLFASLGAVFGYLLNSINKQMMLTKIVGVGATLNIILNLMLIPTYSYLGASIATDFTRLIVILLERPFRADKEDNCKPRALPWAMLKTPFQG